MKFEDLPDYNEITRLYRKIYTSFGSYQTHIVHPYGFEEGVISFRSFNDAYCFLMDNPEMEISDSFFGNNFPFLCGIKVVFNMHAKLILQGLKIFDNIENEIIKINSNHHYQNIGLTILQNQELNDRLSHLYIVDYAGSFFHVSTYEELVDISCVMKIMDY